MSSMGLILSQFSQLSFMKYIRMYFQLAHFSSDDCENKCTSYQYHQQIGSMNPLSLFRVRTWNRDMCCISFYIPLHESWDVLYVVSAIQLIKITLSGCMRCYMRCPNCLETTSCEITLVWRTHIIMLMYCDDGSKKCIQKIGIRNNL